MMADDADRAAEAAVTTKGDAAKDGSSPHVEPPADKAPGTFGDAPRVKRKYTKRAAPLGPGAPDSKSKAWMTKRLAALLRSPAFVFEATGDPWAVEHIDRAGPDLAKALADHAERNPAFKARLVAFLDGGETAGLVFAAIMYAAPLAIYFGILPIPPHFRARLPIPPRGATLADVPEGAVPPGSPIPPTQEALEAEAKAKGFEDLGDYLAAVESAIGGVRGPLAYPNPPS